MCKSVPISKMASENEVMSLLDNATGPISIPLTNDYLFRALLQKNNPVLKALISSLLHIPPDAIHSVKICNPVKLGKNIDAKKYILDVYVLMNNTTSINLEMQVVNEHNWPDRSLIYLSRSFDSLNAGDDYIEIHPTIQIGILNFTLFPDRPEFYASYYIMNEKDHKKYSDKFRLSVLDLTRIDLATNEDKSYGIDHWAAFFKANTWEELKTLANNNQIFGEAAATIYQVSQDESIRLQCQAREEYLRIQRTNQRLFEKKDQLLAEKDQELAERNTQIENLTTEIAMLKKIIEANNLPMPEYPK